MAPLTSRKFGHKEQTNNSYWIEYEGGGELSNMRNSPVSMSPSQSIISARYDSASENHPVMIITEELEIFTSTLTV